MWHSAFLIGMKDVPSVIRQNCKNTTVWKTDGVSTSQSCDKTMMIVPHWWTVTNSIPMAAGLNPQPLKCKVTKSLPCTSEIHKYQGTALAYLLSWHGKREASPCMPCPARRFVQLMWIYLLLEHTIYFFILFWCFLFSERFALSF